MISFRPIIYEMIVSLFALTHAHKTVSPVRYLFQQRATYLSKLFAQTFVAFNWTLRPCHTLAFISMRNDR